MLAHRRFEEGHKASLPYLAAIDHLIRRMGVESFVRVCRVIFDLHFTYLVIPSKMLWSTPHPYTQFNVTVACHLEDEIKSVRELMGSQFSIPDSIFKQTGNIKLKTLFGDREFLLHVRNLHPALVSFTSVIDE